MASEALVKVLMPAYKCKFFDDVCGSMKWAPDIGYIPCGFGGGTDSVQEVRLVVVTAEPSDPLIGEAYNGSPREIIGKVTSLFEDYMFERVVDHKSRYFPNLRKILNLCWKHRSLIDQLRVTWLTNAVKCSARTSGAAVSPAIEAACAGAFLKQEISLFPTAYILALGGKARNRLRRVGISPNFVAQHPSARPITKPELSWAEAAADFRTWLGE